MRDLRHKFFLGLMTCLIYVLSCTSLFASSVTLSWVAPKTNEDGTPNSDLSGYRIYYGTNTISLTNSIDVQNTTTYQITNLSGDLTYYFAVTAYDFYGNESNYSNIISAVALNDPPSEPLLLSPNNKGKGSGKKVGFKWQISTDPDGDSVTYQVTACEDPNLTTGCITASKVASVTSQDIYYAGIGSGSIGFLFSGMVLFLPLNRPLKKGIPLLVATLALAGMFFLVSCGGSRSSGSDGGVTSSPDSNSMHEVSQTVSGFKSNTTYYWRVIAYDGSGGESASEIWRFETP